MTYGYVLLWNSHGIVDTLVRKFKKYFAEEKERAALVKKLSEAASQDDVKAWEAARVEFERDRIHNPKKADEFFKQDLVQGFLCYY